MELACPATSLNSHINQAAIELYLNLTTNYITVETNRTIESVQVYDVLSRSMLTFKNTEQLKTEKLRKGVYFARVQTKEGNSKTIRFVKE